MSEDLTRLLHDQTLGCEKLPVMRIMQLHVDAYLLAEPSEAAEHDYPGLTPARYLQRFVETNFLILGMSDSFQQQVKLLPAE